MDQVREKLDALNQAWRRGNFAAMEALVDEGIAMRGPGLKELARGRQAFIQSYREFMAQSKVIEYAESAHAIDIWGEVSVATYDWSMTYEQRGQRKTDNGHDMFVFRRIRDDWSAVLRLILF
jgi:hypothetical protein